MSSKLYFGIILIALLIGKSAVSKELHLLSSWPENHVFSRVVATGFKDLVHQASDGAIGIKISGPDAVPSFEQFEPTSSGLFDILVTHPVYHFGVTGVGVAIDGTANDPVARREAGIISYVDAHYNSLGLKVLCAPSLGSIGFQYVLNEPITAANAFDGRKIRATPSYHSMIKNLGGTPTNIAPAEVYSALEKGVVDGAAWGMVGVKDLKWNEVSSYLTAPGFGTVGLMVFMNLDAYRNLSAENQQVLDDQCQALELASKETFDVIAAEERLYLLNNGMKLTTFKPDDLRRLNDLMNEGVWEVAAKKSPQQVDELREIARNAGLSN